jgi:hypothetical protein
MTALDGYEIRLVPLTDATAGIRTVPAALLEVAATLGG